MRKYLCLLILAIVFLSCNENDVVVVNNFEGESGTFIDERDEHVYKWVKIGEQIWMAENLAFLPQVSPVEKESIDEPVYYVYQYNGIDINEAIATENYKTYGVLYNWSAAMEASPNGWHLPTDDEWKQLELYIGMIQSEAEDRGWRGVTEGDKLKSTIGWIENGNGTDDYNFCGLPGGSRQIYSEESSNIYPTRFTNLGKYGSWWSASEYGESGKYSLYRALSYKYKRISRNPPVKQVGLSVRCIKDQ